MKNYLLIFAIILASYAFVSAQAKPKAKPRAKKVAAPAKALKTAPAPAAPVITDEPTKAAADKFDPLRDPAADLKEAVTKAQADGKRIILDVGGEWCSWCHFLDNFFAKNPNLQKQRDDNFIWLKVNMSEENENKAFLAAYPAITGYPHLFVLETDGSFLQSQETSVLELGKSYNIDKFTEFLTKWSPVKTAVLPVVSK